MLEEHPDPFDSYRLETDEARDVFTVLPPMNLGLGSGGGPSSTKKQTETDRDSTRQHERRASMDSNASPRREGKKVMTVSEVLGLNEPNEEETKPARRTTQDSTTTTVEEDDGEAERSEDSHFLAARTPEPVATPTSTSTPISPNDSPALPPPSHDPFSEPSLTEESAPFVTRPESMSRTLSTGSTASSRRERERELHGRRLSRVTEVETVEADPMSGDWSTPTTYERPLSSGMNGRDGYESGEVSFQGSSHFLSMLTGCLSQDDNGWRG